MKFKMLISDENLFGPKIKKVKDFEEIGRLFFFFTCWLRTVRNANDTDESSSAVSLTTHKEWLRVARS